MNSSNILKYLILLLFFGHASILHAQNTVTIGSETLNEKAVLMLVSPSGNQGLILPVVNSKAAVNPAASEKGMIVYDNTDSKLYFWTGSSWVDLVAGGTVAISSINELDDVNGAGANPGQVLKWNGTAWEPADDEAGGGAGTDNQELGFDETTKILSIERGNTVDLSSLLGSSGSADDWGAQVVRRDNSLKGDGTTGNPLGLAQQTATNGQVLKWDGTNWTPANDNVASGSGGAVNTSPRLVGDGTVASPLDIAPQGAAAGQVLKWDGSTWKPAADNEGAGGGTTYTAGTGININGTNVISNAGDADDDPTNEIDVTLQSGLLVGDGLAVTGLVGTADGQVPKWNGTAWMPGLDDTGSGSSLWTESGDNIYYSAGNVGIGTMVPAVEPGAGNYLTLSPGGATSSNQFPSLELQGHSGTGDPTIGRIDFISNSAPGNSAIARIASRKANSTQFNGDMSFYTKGGTPYSASSLEERMTIKSNGNVGIGTTDPDGRLHIRDAYTEGVRPFIELTTTGGDRSDIKFTKNGSTHYWHMISGIRTDAASGSMSYYYVDNNTSTQDQILTMRGDGRVGIGKTNPLAKLDIAGGQWDLNNTEGDFRVGNDAIRLKVGVSLGGGGAGIVRMRAQGGTVQELRLGAGTSDVLIVKEDAVVINGEVNSPATGGANMIPIAFGAIAADGTIRAGTGNFTVNKSSLGSGLYDVAVNGEIIRSNTHILLLTLADPSGMIGYRIYPDDVTIFTTLPNNTPFDKAFNFFVYKP